MIDLTYCDLNETKAGDRRWDGKPFVDRPHFDILPEKARDKKCILSLPRFGTVDEAPKHSFLWYRRMNDEVSPTVLLHGGEVFAAL